MYLTQDSNSNTNTNGGRINMAAVWSREENKIFENALVQFWEEEPDRWVKIAGCLRGKTMYDVMMHYDALLSDVKDIEEGLTQLPPYSDFPIPAQTDAGAGGSQSSSRKKGKPWTVEEHRLFLVGLKKYGRSDWRSISRNVVKTRLPSQVASHAQKYFMRLEQDNNKKRKRSSIHDAETVAPLAQHSSDPDSPHTPRNNHASPLPYSYPSTNLHSPFSTPGISSKQPPYTPNSVNVGMPSNLYPPIAQSSPYTLTDVMSVSMSNNLYDPSREQSHFNLSNVDFVSNTPNNGMVNNPHLLMEQSSNITPSNTTGMTSNMYPTTEQSPYATSNTYTSSEQSPSSTDSLAFDDINNIDTD